MKRQILMAFLAIALATPALAQGGRGWEHGGRHGGGWGWGGAWILPALIGGAILYDVTRPPPVYVQPAPVYAPSYVQSYVQGDAPAVAAPSAQYWYFCASSNAYYPYVRYCPSGWQAVPATPPGAAVR